MYVPNADAGLVLQESATQTASSNSAWLDLGRGYAPGGLGALMAAVVNVTAVDRTTGDETYTFKIQQADDDGSDNPNAATIADAGFPESVSDVGVAVPKAIVTSRFIRLVMTTGGTTPSITYSANVGM